MLTEEPDRDLGFDLDVKIPSPTPACAGESGGLAAFSPPDDATGPQIVTASVRPESTFMEQLYDNGYFERIGVDVQPCSMADRWVAPTAT
jgi:hypothetical protein